MHDAPIGVFDSGLGGLTVVQALVDLLPDEHIVYVGDTARYPYGPRDADELIRFSREIADMLLEHGVKMLVVACNSAAAAALDDLRTRLDIPVVGVIEPGVRAALEASRSGHAAVISTEITARSRVYERTAERLRTGLEITTLACPGLVELVEDGDVVGPRARQLVSERLAALDDDVDTVVLGCTHFPLLGRMLSDVLGPEVVLVSSADETAFEIRDLLLRTGWARPTGEPARRRFITTGDPARFAALGERFLGWPLGPVVAHAWPGTPSEAAE